MRGTLILIGFEDNSVCAPAFKRALMLGPTNQEESGGSKDLDGLYIRVKCQAHQIMLTP